MAQYQIMYMDGDCCIGCEVFQSEGIAKSYAEKHYKGFDWFIEQIQ